MSSEQLLKYWERRRNRLLYVIGQVSCGERDLSDVEYEKLVAALNWCEENIDNIESREIEVEYRKEYSDER